LITFCHSAFPLKDDQIPSENVERKMSDFSEQEQKLFYYIYGMNRMTTFDILSQKHDSDISNFLCSCGIRAYEFMIDKNLDIFAQYKSNKKIIEDSYRYVCFLKSPDNGEHIEKIRNAVNLIRDHAKIHPNYSFSAAVSVLDKKKVELDEGVRALKAMLFARDFYDIDSILKLRKRIFKSNLFDVLIKKHVISGTPKNDILSIFFYDYMLLEQAIVLTYDLQVSDFSDDFTESFDFSCVYIYFRFILDIYLLIGQCDTSNFFDESRLEIEISKVYHRLNIILYFALRKYLSPNEHMAFITSSLIDDICLHVQTAFDVDRLQRSVSISSAIARASGHADFSKGIGEICEKAARQWEGGSPLDHKDMIDSFRTHKRYAEFFSMRGFERQLSSSIKQLCRERGFKVIRGVDIASRKGRKKGPDGAGPKS